MRKAKKAFGTKLKRGEVYVANILNINPPEISRGDIDVTNHDSPDGYQEFIPGLRTGGEVPFSGHLVPTEANHLGLAAALDSDEPEPWTIEFPTNPMLRVVFTGYLKSFKIGDATVDGVLTFSATIKVTGKPEMVVDASAGLTNLAVAGSISGTLALMPLFATGTREYFASAALGDASVAVTPTAAGHVITVNGTVVNSGQASGSIPLTAGVINNIQITATEDGKAPVTYTVKVYHE